jgi:hypothetical protein
VSVAPRDPAHRKEGNCGHKLLRKDHPEGSAPTDEMLETHYASLERAACPFCYEGWVYMGYEGVDEDGEHVEVIERVPCRRCNAAAR